MTKLTPAEFKELVKATPIKNMMTKLERDYLYSLWSFGKIAYIYSGGKSLCALDHEPRYSKIRFIVKPKPAQQ